jgi:oxalate decarboxylase/phosphoglucose isomerase-like protein (cupin superfamily)
MTELQSKDTSSRKDAMGARIAPVIDNLQRLQYNDMRSRLEEKMREAQAVDATAGIAIVHLDTTEFPPVIVADREYKFHLARVLPGSHVNPHVHPPKGQEPGQSAGQGPDDEPYFFYSGGEMNTAQWDHGEVKNWKSESVSAGDTYIVESNRVHSLNNPNQGEPLDFAFACPDDHLQNYDADHPEGNRIMTVEIPNGMPPQYEK